MFLQLRNTILITPCNDININIDNQIDVLSWLYMSIENKMIRYTSNHAKFLDDSTEVSKPGTWELFQSIERVMKFTYQARLPLNNKAK